MGSKKRGATTSNVEEGVENDTRADKSVREPTKKKLKEEKKKEETRKEDGSAAGPSPSMTSTSNVSMERKKQRKALDKERHRAAAASASASDGAKVEPKSMSLDTKVDDLDSGEPSVISPKFVLPEFHIGVFKDLASADTWVREKAAEELVKELREVEEAYNKLENKELVEGGLKLEAKRDDGLDNCAPPLRYAIRRLIRGVSSSRECARQGFALGLTVLVGSITSIKVEPLLKLIVDLLEVSSSMKGQEAKNCLLGRLFAYGALARSGRLNEECLFNKSSLCIKEFTSSLISLAAKKRYLQEPAVSVILELVDKFFEVPGLGEWFGGGTEVGNPDALLLALKIYEKTSADQVVFQKLLSDPYCSSRFFSVEHLSFLANCLKETSFCQPRVHSVWPILVNTLLPDSVLQDVESVSTYSSIKKHKKNRKYGSTEEEIEKNVRSFCEVIIEGSLLSSSHDRKHLAFDVLLLLLPRLPAYCVQFVLSHKLVQCLMDILSSKDTWLNKVAKKFLEELCNWIKSDDVRRVAVIVALQKNSNGKFDCITRTRTVRDLIVGFTTESGPMLFVQNMISMFLDGHLSEEPSDQSQTTDDNSEIGSMEDKDSIGSLGTPDFLRSWIVESLPSFFRHLTLESEPKFRVQKEVLKFLAVQGLFSSTLGSEVTSFELQEKFRWPKAASSSALCRMCIEQLKLLLANAQKGEAPHAIASGLEAHDLGSYFMRFLGTLCNFPSVSLFRALSDEDENAFKKLQSMETLLLREERNFGLSTNANKLHALRHLLIQLLLQVLLRPGEFSEAASELTICCKRAFSTENLLESSGEDEMEGDGAPKLMDVLLDTLLSLLPQSSAPMWCAIEQVFKHFCGDVTNDGLLRVIKKDLKPARHQDADSEDSDNDDDDDDLLGIEEAEESDEAETGETGDRDEQTDDSEAVIGVQAVTQDLSDDSEESDGGMDDDAMFRMDSYIAQIFKERKNQAGGETAQSQLVLFKLRVLSLLEIYLHENPGKPEVLKVFTNLAQAFANPHTTEGSEQLGQRIWGIVQKKIFKAKDHPRGEAVQLSMLESLLEKNLRWAAKPFKKKKSANNPSKKKQSASWNRHKMITSLAQNSTFWLLKIIDTRKFSESELQRVFSIFEGHLAAYFDSKKSQMRPEFLKEIFRRRQWIGHHVFGFLLEKCASAKSQFRQVEALDLLIELLKSLISMNTDEGGQEEARKLLRGHLPKLGHLIHELLKNMPNKQSRRADVRKFCGKVFQTMTSLDLATSFLETLGPDVDAACESQLGDLFLALKRSQQ